MFTKTKITVGIIMCLFLLLGGFTFAQNTQQQQPQPQQQQDIPEVSDEELENFVEAYGVVQEMQQDLNQDISKLIDDSSISQQEFQEMYQAQTTNNEATQSDVSDAKKQDFEKLKKEINGMQQELQEEMVSEIEEYDLSVKRFNSIIAAIQQDSELYKKFQELVES